SIQPKHPRPGMRPGCCKRKAHRADHLGYGGRRVLVSRKWSGKTLVDHKADRRAHVLATLAAAGIQPETSAETVAEYVWEKASADQVPSLPARLMRNVAE